MGLQQDLDDFRAVFIKNAPPGRAELYDAKVEEMRRTFPVEAALKAGDRAPGFSLPDATGGLVSLAERLREGPVAVIFYRGGWCPYCNIQLRAYQKALGEITALGARLIAISPQVPDGSMSTAEANGLAFDVLSDEGNRVAHAFGIAYTLPAELQAAMMANGKALPGINGDESWELPLTATYVIAADGMIALAAVELDYRRRLGPDEVIAALRAVKPGAVPAAA